eukprot:3424555-Rhodomonas_salina.6
MLEIWLWPRLSIWSVLDIMMAWHASNRTCRSWFPRRLNVCNTQLHPTTSISAFHSTFGESQVPTESRQPRRQGSDSGKAEQHDAGKALTGPNQHRDVVNLKQQ